VLPTRATIVPFTAVKSGPERTPTDNAEAASTCAVPAVAGDDPDRSGFGSRGSPIRVGHDEGIAVDRADGLRVAVITANVLWTLLDRPWERAPLAQVSIGGELAARGSP
jgi:hypothetical protein